MKNNKCPSCIEEITRKERLLTILGVFAVKCFNCQSIIGRHYYLTKNSSTLSQIIYIASTLSMIIIFGVLYLKSTFDVILLTFVILIPI